MSDYQSVEHIIEALTLKEKLSQLFVVGYWGSSIPDDLVDWANNSLGGLIFFSENITSTSQIKSLITDIQQQSSLKLFMSVDQEGGFVERIKGAIQIPTAMALSASGDLDNVAIAASILSEELKSLGFNLNFAPVLDVNTNPDNPIIGIRSFGDDKDIVADAGLRVSDSFRHNGVIPVAKHFPGHGSVNLDSHKALPFVDATLDQFIDHLYPFEKSILNDIEMIMICHIVFKSLTGNDTLPASLSEEVITNLLINTMKFKGVVITDDLNMKAISEEYNICDAAMLAINAGVDCLLYRDYNDALQVYEYLYRMLELERIPVNRIDHSLYKILSLKQKYGILKSSNISDISRERRENLISLSEKLYENSITVYKSSEFNNDTKKLIVSVNRKSLVHYKSEDDLVLSSLIDNADEICISINPSDEEKKQILSILDVYDEVILITYNAVFNPSQKALCSELISLKNTYVLVAGSPYDVSFLGAAKSICLTYGYTNGSIKTYSRVLKNEVKSNNHLPVSLPL